MHCLCQAIVPHATGLFCTIKNNLHHDGTGPIGFPFEDLHFCFKLGKCLLLDDTYVRR